MITDAYNPLVDSGLVDWEVIRFGLTAVPGYLDRLPVACVASFAMSRLEVIDAHSPHLTRIVTLATEPGLDTRDALALVDRICWDIQVDATYAFRCWRYGSLASLFADPGEDSFWSWMSFYEFFVMWDFEAADDRWGQSGGKTARELGAPLPAVASPPDYSNEVHFRQLLGEFQDWARIEVRKLHEIGHAARTCRIA